MPIVTVKNKYQIVIPQRLRDEVGIAIGDILEARAERGRIIFEPKSLVDRGIARSMSEIKAGLGHGPYKTHKEFLASLRKESAKLDAAPRKRTTK